MQFTVTWSAELPCVMKFIKHIFHISGFIFMFGSLCVIFHFLHAYLSAWLVDLIFKLCFCLLFFNHADELNVRFHLESSQSLTVYARTSSDTQY